MPNQQDRNSFFPPYFGRISEAQGRKISTATTLLVVRIQRRVRKKDQLARIIQNNQECKRIDHLP